MKKKILAEKSGLNYLEVKNLLSSNTLELLTKSQEKKIFGGEYSDNYRFETLACSGSQGSGCQIAQDNTCNISK